MWGVFLLVSGLLFKLLGAGLLWVFALFSSSWFGLALCDKVLLRSLAGFKLTGPLFQPLKG